MLASLVIAVLCVYTLAVPTTALSEERARGVVIGSIVLNEEYFKSKDGLKKTETSRVKRQAVSPVIKEELVKLIQKAIRESQIPVTSGSSNSPQGKTVQMNDVMNMFQQSLQLLKENGLTLTVSGKDSPRDQGSRSPFPSDINVVPISPNPMVHAPTFPIAPRHPMNPNMNFIPVQLTQPFQFNSHFGHIGNQGLNRQSPRFIRQSPGMQFMIPQYRVQSMMDFSVPYAMPAMVAG